MTPRLLKPSDAAAYLGVSPTTLRSLDLPRRRLKRRVLYDRHDLDEYADRLPYDSGAVEGRQACDDPDEVFG